MASPILLMPSRLTLKALLIWFLILVMAILNGIFREAVLYHWFGTITSQLVSGLLLSAIIIAVTYMTLPWLNARRFSELLSIGLGWFVLTIVFEFSFGLLQGISWQVLLEAYTFKEGNIWPVVLLVTALAPLIAGKLRGIGG